MLELVLIRHGQSTGDAEERLEGWLDFPLTPRGRRQAQLAAEWLAVHLPVDQIISSPLKRAAETAEIIAEHLPLAALRFDNDLMSYNTGELAGLSKIEAMQRNPPRHGDWYLPHEPAPGGESLITFRSRAEGFFSKLLLDTGREGRVGLVTHGNMISMLFRCFINVPVLTEVRLVVDFGSIHLLQIDGRKRRIVFLNRSEYLDVADLR